MSNYSFQIISFYVLSPQIQKRSLIKNQIVAIGTSQLRILVRSRRSCIGQWIRPRGEPSGRGRKRLVSRAASRWSPSDRGVRSWFRGLQATDPLRGNWGRGLPDFPRSRRTLLIALSEKIEDLACFWKSKLSLKKRKRLVYDIGLEYKACIETRCVYIHCVGARQMTYSFQILQHAYSSIRVICTGLYLYRQNRSTFVESEFLIILW
jgi:hypothetical protein